MTPVCALASMPLSADANIEGPRAQPVSESPGPGDRKTGKVQRDVGSANRDARRSVGRTRHVADEFAVSGEGQGRRNRPADVSTVCAYGAAKKGYKEGRGCGKPLLS
jgi:hypothetical protein